MINNQLDDFSISEHYQEFSVTRRTLLTGHSHQAWPDCALSGLQEAWHDATVSVDDKWEKAFKKADKLKQFFAELVGTPFMKTMCWLKTPMTYWFAFFPLSIGKKENVSSRRMGSFTPCVDNLVG